MKLIDIIDHHDSPGVDWYINEEPMIFDDFLNAVMSFTNDNKIAYDRTDWKLVDGCIEIDGIIIEAKSRMELRMPSHD